MSKVKITCEKCGEEFEHNIKYGMNVVVCPNCANSGVIPNFG